MICQHAQIKLIEEKSTAKDEKVGELHPIYLHLLQGVDLEKEGFVQCNS
ncbi:MAG: hypothetical protein K1000chlam3_00019 [Chlamydiae bacterium]|nr:hypothetical protein [Chlamydiota bacterium]